MNAPVPGPPGVDPASVRAQVAAALGGSGPDDGGAGALDRLDAAGLAEQARSLDALHRALAAALDTIDRV